MSARLEALVPRTWEAWREFMLTTDALLVGIVYTFGPERLQSAGAFAEAQYYLKWVGGMDFVGGVCLFIAALLIFTRFFSGIPYFARIAYATGSMVYFIYGTLIGAALLTGESDAGAGFYHLWVISWLFFRASAEAPMLPVEKRYVR